MMAVIAIIVGAFGTVSKGFEKRLEEMEINGKIETIPTTVLLRPARILRRVKEIREDLLSHSKTAN